MTMLLQVGSPGIVHHRMPKYHSEAKDPSTTGHSSIGFQAKYNLNTLINVI